MITLLHSAKVSWYLYVQVYGHPGERQPSKLQRVQALHFLTGLFKLSSDIQLTLYVSVNLTVKWGYLYHKAVEQIE